MPWLTCATSGREHAVTYPEMAAGVIANRGEYLAVCGRMVLADSLMAPPGPPCHDCRDITEQPAPPPRRRWWWRRRNHRTNQ